MIPKNISLLEGVQSRDTLGDITQIMHATKRFYSFNEHIVVHAKIKPLNDNRVCLLVEVFGLLSL